MQEQLKEIFTSYYFWLALEAVIIAVLVVFTSKYSRLRKSRTEDMMSKHEMNLYNKLDEQITNKKGANR